VAALLLPAGRQPPLHPTAKGPESRQALAVSLTGGEAGTNNLLGQGIEHLIERCKYLIETRGFGRIERKRAFPFSGPADKEVVLQGRLWYARRDRSRSATSI
jgi:hypothetical protein